MATDYADDDFIFDTQWLAMKRAINGNGILSGLGMTPGTGMQVLMAAGHYHENLNKRSIVSQQTININAAHATHDRWDLIYSKTSSPFWTYVAGTAAIVPKPPDLPGGHIILGLVYVPATITQILSAHIRDFGFSTSLLEHYLRHLPDNSDGLTIGAPSDIGTSNVGGVVNAFVRQDHIHNHPAALGANLHHNKQHGLGSATEHSSATIAQLNALVSDANMDDSGDTRAPASHDHTKHTNRTRYSYGISLGDPPGASIPDYVDAFLPSSANRATGYKYPDGGSREKYFFIPWPEGVTTPTGSIEILYAADDDVAAGNVALSGRLEDLKDNTSEGSGGWNDTLTIDNDGNVHLHTVNAFSQSGAGEGVIFSLSRTGSAGPDTFTGNFYVLMVRWKFTADQ